jgi:hypothetical protein
MYFTKQPQFATDAWDEWDKPRTERQKSPFFTQNIFTNSFSLNPSPASHASVAQKDLTFSLFAMSKAQFRKKLIGFTALYLSLPFAVLGALGALGGEKVFLGFLLKKEVSQRTCTKKGTRAL